MHIQDSVALQCRTDQGMRFSNSFMPWPPEDSEEQLLDQGVCAIYNAALPYSGD